MTTFSINLKNKRIDGDDVIPKVCRSKVRNLRKIIVSSCLHKIFWVLLTVSKKETEEEGTCLLQSMIMALSKCYLE